MRDYLSIDPNWGRQRKRRRACRMMKEQQEDGYGRRPGRVEDIQKKCEGYLDEMLNLKGPGVFRVLFQNIGTLKIGDGGESTERAIKIKKEAEVDTIRAWLGRSSTHEISEKKYIISQPGNFFWLEKLGFPL